MTIEEQRIVAATLMRELGHEFVGRIVDDEQLQRLNTDIAALLEVVRDAPVRVRELSRDRLEEFALTIPTKDESGERQLFADSVVTGAANPMGIAAQLWRDGDAIYMQVTLDKAFEGAPGRAHGGIVAAILDEVMGSVNALDGALAYTAQLDISYHAPTPVGEPILARAWLDRHDDRKRYVEATLFADDLLVASAKGLFITIDRSVFLDQLLSPED
ncbi:MAG TPA: PaaI family thioesterase [Acidimicrobiales bacterium]